MKTDWRSSQTEQLLPGAKVKRGRMIVPRNQWSGIPDISMAGGVCFALSTEWCYSALKGQDFDQAKALPRALARQRAYNATFEHQIKNLTDGSRYHQFFQATEPPSFRFMQDQFRHEGRTCVRQSVKPGQISIHLRGQFMQPAPCLLGFFGVENGKNWGHATALGGLGSRANTPRFYDPNQGQFSWPAQSNSGTIAQEILSNLDRAYGLYTIRDFVIYGFALS